MADFDDIDALLSDSLKKAAEPANSAGVADAIRARVDAGDAGTAVAGTTAPGWGGGASGIVAIVAPIALIVVAGVVGAALGVSGVFGSAQPPLPDGTIPPYVVTSDVATAYTCPGGVNIDNIPAGTRVYAVARNDDSTWLGVRDPDDVERTLWLETSVVVLDEGADTSTLPIDGCPEPTITIVTPEPTVEPTPTDPPTSNPQPPRDTVAPLVTSLKANKTIIYNNEAVTLSFASSDNVAVSFVRISWSNTVVTGSVDLGPSGNYNWSSNGTANNTYGNYTFTAVAYDAAGNASAPVSVTVNRQYFG